MKKDATIGKEIFEWLKVIALALVIVALGRYFIAVPVLVEGHSMDNTLRNGELLIVNKFTYAMKEPQRGDIVVFRATEDKDFIKRVIAVGGDVVEMKKDVLKVNGQVVNETYIQELKDRMHEMGYKATNDFGPITVEQGKVFVLGDNRPESMDSRSIGAIDVHNVIGRADLVIYPFNTFGKIENTAQAQEK